MTGKRILIVDDEQRSLLFLRECLLIAGLNAELMCVSSPEAALAAFQNQSFDLLIADICLVGMDGVELLEELRKLQPKLPAVLVSGHYSPALEARIQNLAAAHYFRKPFAFEEFTSTVTALLRETRPTAGGDPSAPGQIDIIQRRLTNLLQDAGAQSVCLTDSQGHVVTQAGHAAMYLDQWKPPADVGDGSFNFTYHQGRTHDIYSAKVSEGLYLVIAFDRDRPSTRIGQVLQHTRRAVQEVGQILYAPSGAVAG